MRILIVDDDAALGLFLQRGLRLEGHVADILTDGRAAMEAVSLGHYELIVLELNLPRMDGMQLLEEMRKRSVDASIFVLTARSAMDERIRCFDLGADDFMLKPFSFSELTARCRALMRRRVRFADPLLRQGDLELNRMERRVSRNKQVVDLTVKEFALLEYLMLARGRICSRSELLEEVWQMSPDAGTNVVDVYVNYLRKKLGEGQAARAVLAEGERETLRLIETVRGEGYCLRSIPLTRESGRKPVASVPADFDSLPAYRHLPAAAGGYGQEALAHG